MRWGHRSLLVALAASGCSENDPNLDNLVVHERSQLTLRHAGERITVSTLVGPNAEKLRVAVGADGEPVDLDSLLARERAEERARCGKTRTTLCDRLSVVDEPVRVSIWVVFEEPEPDRTLLDQSVDAFRGDESRFSTAMADRLAKVREELATKFGITTRPSRVAPVLWATLTPAVIRRVEALDGVGAVDLVGEFGGNDLVNARALASWSAPGPTFDGTGVPVGVLEHDAPHDPSLLSPTLIVRLPDDIPGSPAGPGHATMVTGMIANFVFGQPGFGNDAEIFLANRTDTETNEDVDWAASMETRVHNQSWHGLTEETSAPLSDRDHYLDYNTRAGARFYALAAGNHRPSEPPVEYVNHKGYNLLTVGATYPDGTIVDRSKLPSCLWASAWDSAFRNAAPHILMEQELPHISAQGYCIEVTGDFAHGTSMASPSVAGIAAGLVEHNVELGYRPEGLKAIILASPSGKSEASPDGCPWRFRRADEPGSGDDEGGEDEGGGEEIPEGCKSDGRDGTGLVNGTNAAVMADPANFLRDNDPAVAGHDYGVMEAHQFSPPESIWESHWNASMSESCGPGSWLKVALSWLSNVSCTPAACESRLDMDLDLLVYEDETLVAQSSTTGNSYEFIDLPADCTATYRIEVRLNPTVTGSGGLQEQVPPEAWTFFGLAWHSDPLPPP